MKNFIKVTLTSTHDVPFAYVNTANIASIVPDDEGSLIYLVGASKELLQLSKRIYCKEMPEDIISLIEES